MSRPRISFQNVLPALLLIVALIIACSIDNDPTRHITELAYRLDQKLLLSAVGVFTLQQLFRCLRLSGLLPSSVPFLRLQGISLIQVFSGSLLPMHLGSLTLPELLRREGIPRSSSWAAQTLIAAIDLFVAAILTIGYGVFFLSRPMSSAWSTPVSSAIALSYFAVFALAVVAIFALRRATGSAQTESVPTDNDGVHGRSPGEWLRRTGPQILFASGLFGFLSRAISQVHRALLLVSRNQLYRCTLLTALTRLLSLTLSMVVCLALAPSVEWPAALAICLMMPFISAVGVHGVAGIGTSDAALAALLSIAGVDISEAVTVAILARALHFLLSMIGGGIGLLCLSVSSFPPRSSTNLSQKGEGGWTN